MTNKAMDAIRDEMAANPKDFGIQGVGEVMTALIRERPEIAQAVTAKGKTLKGAYQALYEYANKNKGGSNCYYMGPGKTQELLAGYYGFDAAGQAEAPVNPHTSADTKDDDLLALLEGI